MKELYQSYEQWCQNSGLEPASKESLGKELTRRGFPKERRRHGMVYVGIALKPDEDLNANSYASGVGPIAQNKSPVARQVIASLTLMDSPSLEE
jgi:phage/plasmid-associated DNA primase